MPSDSPYLQAARRHKESFLRFLRRKKAYDCEDSKLKKILSTPDVPFGVLADSLVRYFWISHLHYVDETSTLAYYPGCGSIYGARNDAIEGVSRVAPLWATYARCANTDPVMAEAMLALLRESFVHGTSPAHPGYWGDVCDRSLLICEAADIALALWLARDRLIPLFSSAEFNQVMRWLGQVVGKATADNNWHIFVVLVDAVLAALAPAHRFTSFDRLARVRSFQQRDGCFVDGPDGRVDYYNAWGFHYGFFWIREILPGLDMAGMDESIGPFCRWYRLLFTHHGVPLFGRSLCYRFATTVPMLACAFRDPQLVPPGVALSAWRAVWQFFGREGGLVAGRPTQGVFGDDLRWLDPYSGPASSLWGVRSLVMYLYLSAETSGAVVQPLALPATLDDYSVRVEGLGATLSTDAARGTTTLTFDQPWRRWNFNQETSARAAIRRLVFAVPHRPQALPNGDGRRFTSDLEDYRL